MKTNKENMDLIGNVVLNYNYYSGEDFYSEGISEDILLDLVKRYQESEYEHVIQNSRSWSVMYHLSYIRENIVSWLPIKKTDKVLEIGAGPGAITGKLAELAGKVTCIELSKKRSLINANRHKEYDNIEIVVGNFKDIEQEITETYDYITLIGVLEYAESYIGGKNPYQELLKTVGAHLAPGGKIVIAIENRFGLKYFAGCKEDHTGCYFDGIEGYKKNSGVRTFSKEKLEQIVKEAGYASKFYYPYPDYKLPHTIYSDEYLPKAGELTTNLRNFDADRVVTFDEAKVFDSMIEEGLFPHYSNSFLVMASKEDIWKTNETMPVYAKYANERSQCYRVATLIEQSLSGERSVYKTALNTKTNPHIVNIFENYEYLCKAYEGTVLKPNKCRLIEGIETEKIAGVTSKAKNRVELTYLRGMTLEKYFDYLDEAAEYDKMLALLRKYKDIMTGLAQGSFSMTEGFKTVFGNRSFDAGYAAAPVCNYDMIFSNIVLDEEEKENGVWNVLDYEWMFKFPIPVKFLIYRSLFYQFEHREDSGFLQYLTEQDTDVYRLCGIEEAEKRLFADMEHCFQVYIISGIASLEVMQAMMPSATVRLERMLVLGAYLRNLNTPKIYFSQGDGFFTENQIYILGQVSDEHIVSLSIPLTGNMTGIRLDPTEYPCLLHVNSIEIVTENGVIAEIDRYLTNGMTITENTLLFDTDDAQLIFEKLPRGAKEIHAEYQVTMLPEAFYKETRDMLLEKRESEKEKPSILDRILIKCGVKETEELPEGFAYNKGPEVKE